MKQNYLLLKKVLGLLVLAAIFANPLKAQLTTQTFSYTGAIQSFTVPPLCVSNLTIEARGASGGSVSVTCTASGGLGASMRGVFTVTPGQVLSLLVGQAGFTNGSDAGGGGGSFVVAAGNVPLIVAGGGGGATNNITQCGSNRNGLNASITTTATASANGLGLGGVNGAGGSFNGSGGGGAGGGFNTNGGFGQNTIGYGRSYLNGGAGGTNASAGDNGGFGGGGCGWQTGGNGGGGGGYSGGGCSSGSAYSGGGGGGSYNSGTSQVNTAGVQLGNGVIIITYVQGTAMTANVSPTLVCSGSPASLNASGVTSYTWSTGSNSSSITVNPSSNTAYTVQGTNASGCTSSVVVTVSVNATVPTLTVVNTGSNSICPGSPATLTASGASTYTWSGSVTNGVAFNPTSTSGYTVTGANACGTSVSSTTISVNPTPTVNAIASTASLCSGATATLIGSSTGSVSVSSYSWTGGVTNGVSFAPTATTIYTLTGTSALGCTASAVASITVVTTPNSPPVALPGAICFGSISTLQAGGATNYTWNPGNFSTSSVTVSPAASTIYTITRSNGNCVDTQTLNLIVNQLPNLVILASSPTLCAGKSLTLQAGGASSYTWTQGTFTITGVTAIVSPTATTVYSIAANNGTCTSNNTYTVATLITPTISVVASPSVICNGFSTNLTANGASTYTWSSPVNLNTAGVTVSPTAPISYSVSGTNTAGCTSGTTQVIVVNQNPVLTTGATPSVVCKGGASTATVTGANTYTWSTGFTGSATAVTAPVTSIYTVTGTFANTGCASSKTVTVVVFEPTLTVTSATAVCLGTFVTLSAAGAVSYTWNTGLNTSTISVSPSVFTTYSISATTSSVIGGIPLFCLASNTIDVSVNQNPTVTSTCSRTLICKGESTTLNAAGATTYNWAAPVGTTGSTVSVSPNATTTFSAVGTDTNNCIGTTTIQIKVSACVGIEEMNGNSDQIFVFPNPNNGEFTIKSISDINLTLINELGQTVRSISLAELNNHQVNVSDLANGIYFVVGRNTTSNINQKIIVAK